MIKQTIIPFGPQHPVLPEPLQLDLILEDEKVVQAIPSIGYVHRGLETLVTKQEYQEFVYIAERICGICSFIHGMGYCQAIEEIMKVEVPERGVFLRTIWAELSRIHSHLLWLGLAADAFGFENLFMQAWRIRETILDIFERTTGGRVIFSVCKVGGARKDIPGNILAGIGTTLENVRKEVVSIAKIFLNDNSVKHRTAGVGVLSEQDAKDLGAVGPVLRASGVSSDTRLRGYAAYPHAEFDVITHTDGDCYARCAVRIGEIYQSIDIIHQLIPKTPEGAVDVKVIGAPRGESYMRLEQPRGEVLYYVKANGTRLLDRFRVRTPTFANIPPLVQMLQGCDVADVPNILLTIDPCISCTER
ncbi:MAG: NADH dehydrogenase [Spirochaetes bacterium GWF1_51_8]|nr:MAG: NADH dehydrogenase [Spirochaetes bacterium GWF1_51_8]